MFTTLACVLGKEIHVQRLTGFHGEFNCLCSDLTLSLLDPVLLITVVAQSQRGLRQDTEDAEVKGAILPGLKRIALRSEPVKRTKPAVNVLRLNVPLVNMALNVHRNNKAY